MNNTTKLGFAILSAALALGLLGDALLRATPWGLNVGLWMAALILTGIALVRRQRIALTGDGRWLVVPALLFAAAFAWRDSLTLKSLDALALLIALAFVLRHGRAGSLRIAGIADYASSLLLAALYAFSGPIFLLFRDIRWQALSRARWLPQAQAIGRGLLLALPLLLIFGGLFMSADAVFQHFVLTLFRLDLQNLLTHLLIIGVVTWLVAGTLRGMLGAEEFALPESTPARTFSLGSTEICVVLGLLDALFFGFVLVQLRYLFGGAALVASTTGLSYAQYARRGFFELVTVAAVALPLLLLVHWLLPTAAPRSERRFRALAGTQVVLLFVIMTSALQRMRLYQSAYGLTELRLYTTAFMVWLSLVFLWFAATVLRGRRERFVFGALVAGFLVIGALHILNPDSYIVRVNAARADRRFDADYATSLSADAVPALIAALPDLKPQARALVTAHLRARWSPPRSADWRTWNLARAQAWQAVRAGGLRQ